MAAIPQNTTAFPHDNSTDNYYYYYPGVALTIIMFRFGDDFPFPFPPPPNILSNFSWAYRCVRSRVNTAGSVRMQYIVHQTGT